jgi:hypothetical protein
METLSEIEKAEEARRENAWRYEKLLDEQKRMRQSIERLEALASANDVKALEKMHALCAQVPKDLLTKGSKFCPGGFQFHVLLQCIVTDALADVKRKADAAQTALVTTRKNLAQVEQALKEFE